MVFREELPTDLPTLPEWTSNIYAQHFLQLLAQFSFIKSGFFVHSSALAHSEQCLFLSLQPVGKNSNAIWVSRSKSRADQEESSHHPRKVIFYYWYTSNETKALTVWATFPTIVFHKFPIFLALSILSPEWTIGRMLIDTRSCKGTIMD